jgi:CcmD family protein
MTDAQSQPTVADRSSEFVAVQGGGETSSAAGLLTAAYIIMWLLVFVFVWLTSKRLKGVSARVEELESALKKADAASRPAS